MFGQKGWWPLKYKWTRKIVGKLPQTFVEERKKVIKNSFAGNRKQLEEQVIESLCRQVRQVLIFAIIFIIGLAAMAVAYVTQDREIVITRNDRGEDAKEESLEIKTKEGKETYQLEVRPRGYKKSEITQVLKRGKKYLEKYLKGNNKSLNEVKENLNMPEQIPGENIQLQWESDDLTIINTEGKVFLDDVKSPVIVWITARMKCQGQEEIFKTPVCVVPRKGKKKVTQADKLMAMIRKMEENNLTKQKFSIPKEIEGNKISVEGENQKFPTIIFLGIFIIVYLWYRENERYKKQAIVVKAEARREYPIIISKLVLYLEIGMSVPNVFEEIYKEYKKSGRSMFVYEVIGKCCRQISFGVSQVEVFQELGDQLDLASYRKLSSMLAQSITRGSDDLFIRLKAEEEDAFFERKEYAKQQGEEASTKLLAPMILMLVIILTLLMFPALSTFS